MFKTKILIVTTGIILIIILFNLPKIVVENDQTELTSAKSPNEQSGSVDSVSEKVDHVTQIPAFQLTNIVRLRELVKNDADKKKSAIFADSLSMLFERYQRYDSAAFYATMAADFWPKLEYLEKAGDSNYKAFTFAAIGEKQKQLAETAESFFKSVLEIDPDRLDLQAKIAMTLVVTSNPMAGVAKLREIVDQDPQNTIANFNLGLLSIQSRQFDRAVERFNLLVSLDSLDSKSWLYLGISELNLGENEKARNSFQKVMELSKDPALVSTAKGYLDEIE